jgi:LPXTG-motif cell wall-anchored protein
MPNGMQPADLRMEYVMHVKSSTLLVTLAAFSIVALAAHRYDMSKSTTLSGTVTKVEWNNKDYVKIHMNAPGKQGKTTDWEIQTVSAEALQSGGINNSGLKNGDQITVEGFKAASGSPHMLASSITLAIGQTVAVKAQEQPGQEPVQTGANPQSLPSTASNMPVIALIGLVSLIGGGVLVSLRRES